MAFCIYCGKKLVENANFCLNCGAAVSHNEPAKPTPAQPVIPAPKAPVNTSPAQPVPTQQISTEKKQKRALAVILILMGVLLIGCGVAVVADVVEDNQFNFFGLLNVGVGSNNGHEESAQRVEGIGIWRTNLLIDGFDAVMTLTFREK